jgi:hypothetical protein
MFKGTHRRIYACGLPVFLLLYIAIAGYGKLFGNGEIFPFFSWSLFSGSLDKARHYIVLIESVNGQPVAAQDRIITAHNHRKKIRVEKALIDTIYMCNRYGQGPECGNAIENKIRPLVANEFVGKEVQFTFALCELDFDFVKKRFLEAKDTVPEFNDDQCHYTYQYGPYIVSHKE